MKYLIPILLLLTACSLEKKLARKQNKVDKLQFEISQIKEELNLPLDSTIISIDTFLIEKGTVKYDTIKAKCDSFGNIIVNDTVLIDGQIVVKTKYIDRIVQKNIEKVRKEIVYKDRDFKKSQLAMMAVGFVTILVGLFYALGSTAGFIIKLLINKKLI